MSTIPQVPTCRYITIEQIQNKIKEDSFTYTQVRVIGKCKSYSADTHTVELEDLFSEGTMMKVNVF